MKKFFEAEKIEYYAELEMSRLRIYNERKYNELCEKYFVPESAIIFLIPYNVGQITTNLSVYAQVPDYHLYAREIMGRFEEYLNEFYPDIKAFCCADNSPIDERSAVLSAGLGVIGKNGLILNEKYGSYVFIGEFFLSKKIVPVIPHDIKYCDQCGLCEKACPTGAIFDPERKKCLSLLTQKKELTSEEAELIKNADCKWGCDICQNICPKNKNALLSEIEFFKNDNVNSLTFELIEEEKKTFSKRAYSWRGRNVLRRNLEKK